MSPQRRQVVTSPQTRLAHARRRHRTAWRPPALDPAEVRRAVEVYRAQRVLAVGAIAALLLLMIGLPLVLRAHPELDEVRVLDIPVSWLALVLVPYPAMVALSWWQLRRAERAEDTAAPPGPAP
ncbi:hypothetical protein ACTG9Q_32750 [Actinokineospora sp. 24-640]